MASSSSSSSSSQKNDRINELAWSSFAAYVNSGGDANSFAATEKSFSAEPTEDDYINYFNFLSKANPGCIGMTFIRLRDGHLRKYGKDLGEIFEQLVDTFKPSPVPADAKTSNVELAWSSFAAFINSEGNEFSREPTEDDYLRYFDFLWEVKNYKSSSLCSSFTQLREFHRNKYGNDIQEVWPKITLMCEKKKGAQKIIQKVAKSVPEKNKRLYERNWKEFETFTGKYGNEEPTEEDYLKFFNYLGEVRKCKWSSLYAYFSRLNTGHQMRYGRDLKCFATRLLNLLNNYKLGYVKKTELHFTKKEIERALKLKCNSTRMLLWKAALSVSHCGELRLSDLIFIKLQDVNVDRKGVKIECRGKSFLLPFNQREPKLCFASHLINYMEVMRKSVTDLRPTDRLFRAPKDGFAVELQGLSDNMAPLVIGRMGKWSALGVKTLIKIGRHLAREMGLDNFTAYGSRAFCLREKSRTRNRNEDALDKSENITEDTEDNLGENANVTKETNFVLARRQFRRCKQGVGEMLGEFAARLRGLAESCGFCDERCLDENLLEQLIEGLHDRNVAQKLLHVPDLTMEVALGICKDGRVEENPLVISETHFIEECLYGIDGNVANARNKVNCDDVDCLDDKIEGDKEHSLDNFASNENSENQIEDMMDTAPTEKLLHPNNSNVEGGEALTEVEELTSQEHENLLPDPTAKSRAIAQDIQDTIGSALKSDQLSPKHLLGIMQKMFELQKNNIDKTEDGSRKLAEERSTKEPGIRMEEAARVQINSFSEEFTMTTRQIQSKKVKDFWRQETAKACERSWKEFGSFINSFSDFTDNHIEGTEHHEQKEITVEPPEGDYLRYLNFLSEVKQLKSSTIVNMFSRLNSSHMSRFKRSPQNIYPGLHRFIKSRRARKFSKEQIQRALQLDRGHSSEWIMKKAAISIAFCGGLSISDLRNIKLWNVEINQRGVWVTYPGSDEEEDGRKDDDGFLVPYSPSESGGPGPCLASIVVNYLDGMRGFLPDLGLDAPLFHKTLKYDSFSKDAVGHHRMHELGKEVAFLLGLDSPETYLTNCFNLSLRVRGIVRPQFKTSPCIHHEQHLIKVERKAERDDSDF